MRLLCIKGHDVINLQIKSIKSFISENCSCQKKIMPEKKGGFISNYLYCMEKNGCKNNKCRRIHLNVHVQKKKKLIANNFKRIVMTPLNVHSIFKTNISNNYHVPLKYFNVLIAITKSGFFSK